MDCERCGISMRVLLITLLSCLIFQVHAELFSLKVARIEEHPASADYYIELLERSLDLAGHNVIIETVTVPQARAVAYLNSGRIDLFWMLATPERDALYEGIDFPLTAGLMGHRLLLIRTDEQEVYSRVQSLDEFRALGLVAAFGPNWFDSEVWRYNKLPYAEHMGNWVSIYPMLQNRRVYDYFPRGAVEIAAELAEFPYLALEQTLLLRYDTDFKFYLSDQASMHKETLSSALQQAAESGLFDQVFAKYWADALEPLNLSGRTVIDLALP